MSELAMQIKEATRFIQDRSQLRPRIAIILGTGLGGIAGAIDIDAEIPYPDIPGFVESTVEDHVGRLLLGRLDGTEIVAMDGRYHLYEGYTPLQVTFPVRVIREMGGEILIISNACGGMNRDYQGGDIVLIEDHINLMGVNPLVGPNDDDLGPRYPDMFEPYDPELLELAERVAMEERIRVHRAVYVGVVGPNLETRAEYRFLSAIGADVVGMSTVPEVIVAIHAGMRTLGLSIVTDMCLPDALALANIDEILATAAEAEPKLRKIVLGILAREAGRS